MYVKPGNFSSGQLVKAFNLLTMSLQLVTVHVSPYPLGFGPVFSGLRPTEILGSRH